MRETWLPWGTARPPGGQAAHLEVRQDPLWSLATDSSSPFAWLPGAAATKDCALLTLEMCYLAGLAAGGPAQVPQGRL